LQQLSAAAALGMLARAPRRLLAGTAPAELVPELDDALLTTLACVAIDAARRAGASFADVRIGSGQLLSVTCDYSAGRDPRLQMDPPGLELNVSYGVRVVVDGAWGFAAGHGLTADDVAETARRAVARARANRPRRPRMLELAPAPVIADGRWAVPIERDPFEVPAGEQADLQLAALEPLMTIPEVKRATIGFSWQRANRVFASSEGSSLSQRIAFAGLGAGVTASAGDGLGWAAEGVDGFESSPIGYEAVTRIDLRAGLRRAAERAIAESRIKRPPPVPAEVGRFDVVVSPGAMAELVGALVPALDGERAFGYTANAAGTSFAAPPADIIGRYQVGSRLLTLEADRTRPGSAATIGWDDEGVPAEAFTLVREGVIVDYLTTRQTAVELAPSYRARGERPRSRGCASGCGHERPGVRLPNLTVQPGPGTVDLDDLVRDTKRGYYLDAVGGASDQQVLNTQFRGWRARIIRNGKLGGYVSDLAFQFITPSFWKGLDALGGTATAKRVLRGTGFGPGDPVQLRFATTSAVPGRFRQVNVLNTGRTA
jgi:TldD protein